MPRKCAATRLLECSGARCSRTQGPPNHGRKRHTYYCILAITCRAAVDTAGVGSIARQIIETVQGSPVLSPAGREKQENKKRARAPATWALPARRSHPRVAPHKLALGADRGDRTSACYTSHCLCMTEAVIEVHGAKG